MYLPKCHTFTYKWLLALESAVFKNLKLLTLFKNSSFSAFATLSCSPSMMDSSKSAYKMFRKALRARKLLFEMCL